MSNLIVLAEYPYVPARRYTRRRAGAKNTIKSGYKITERPQPPALEFSMTTPAAASAVNVSNATSAPAVAPGEVPVDAEKVSMKDAVERIEKEVGKNTPEAKEAIKGLIAAWNKDHGVLAFGKRNWIALTAGSVATVLVVGGVIYWVRRRSALAAAAVEAAAATAGLEVALIDGVSRGLV